MDPAAPTWQSNGWTDLGPRVGGTNADAEPIYMEAGNQDLYWQWVFNGVWNQQLKCVAQNPRQGWNTTCTLNKLAGNGCFDVFPPAQQPVSPGGQLNALGVNLNAFLQGQFTGGQVTSLPASPRPGLVNVPTCFYVSGMTVNRQPANPQQDVYWERIVQSPAPADGEGRHVYFVFVIHVAYQDTVWDFGDSSPPVDISRDGSSPETPPGACQNLPNWQFLVAHTYHSYSTGDGFHVTVSHRYGVDVRELWRDSAPNAHELDFPGPQVTVPALPQPYYAMRIVQEEGVPVG